MTYLLQNSCDDLSREPGMATHMGDHSGFPYGLKYFQKHSYG